MDTQFAPADGFDVPVGDSDDKTTGRFTRIDPKGWFVSSHFLQETSRGINPGEDWNRAAQKDRGEFDGPDGEYYGGHWIKINYPNEYDAAWGRSEGLITPKQESAIAGNWARRAPTLEGTRLGGGIGFHGWIKEWNNAGPRHLSWGCVVVHLSDIGRLYDQIPEGTMVIIF